MLSKRLIFLSLLMLTTAVAAQSAVEVPTAKEASDEKINVFDMKRKLQEQTRDIQKLTKEVNNVEVTLGLNNKKYLKLAEDRAKIEESLSSARKNADLDSEGLKKSYSQTKSLLMGVLLNKLENTENSSDMLARKVMIERLQRKLADLDGLMKANKNLQNDVDDLYARLQESMNTEKELLSIMGELEERRRELRNSLESQTKNSTAAQMKLDEEKNKLAMNQKAQQKQKERERIAPMQITEEIKVPSQPVASGEGFRSPINSYQGMKYDKKGITFDFNGKNEVHAPKGGKVVHVGALANYGNVIMIDHGLDTRTVLFGQFDYSVKNGDVVRESQVVGFTNPRSTSGLGGGSLYFEVRKNNLAQNTYLLLDKKSKTSSN
jgi:murein DD-endopeptidase MepM/ murein hydrolase activator NlpD